MMIGLEYHQYSWAEETKELTEERHLEELHNHEATKRLCIQHVVFLSVCFTLFSSSSVATASKTCLGIIRVRLLSRAAFPLNSSNSAVDQIHVFLLFIINKIFHIPTNKIFSYSG